MPKNTYVLRVSKSQVQCNDRPLDTWKPFLDQHEFIRTKGGSGLVYETSMTWSYQGEAKQEPSPEVLEVCREYALGVARRELSHVNQALLVMADDKTVELFHIKAPKTRGVVVEEKFDTDRLQPFKNCQIGEPTSEAPSVP